MSDNRTALRAAAATATVLAIGSGSVNAALTFLLIPRLLELPEPLNVRGWSGMFNVTKWWVAGPMVLSGLGFCGVAGGLRHHARTAALLYSAAGALCLSVVPFTRLVVLPTIHQLYRKVEAVKDWQPDRETEDDEGQSSHALIKRWGTFNLGRAIPVLSAGLIGLYALVQENSSLAP